MRTRLFDVLQCCQAISEYTAGLDFAAYERNPMVRDAVERRIGIIGEALNRAVDLAPEIEERGWTTGSSGTSCRMNSLPCKRASKR